mgnify:FL=1
MDKETELFYNTHKDKTFKLPHLPSDMDPKDGVTVAKWVIQQMLSNNIGYLELDMKSVNVHDYIDLAFNYKARLESDKCITKMKKLPLGDIQGLTLYNNKWFEIPGADVTEIADWWFNNSAIDKLNKLNIWNTKPGGYARPHNINIDPPTDNVDTLDLIGWPLPLMTCLNEPGLDCHTVVEDFGLVPNQLGKTFLINPNKQRCIVNKGASDSTRLFAHGQIGVQFQRFTDLVTRSYLRTLAIQDRDDNN